MSKSPALRGHLFTYGEVMVIGRRYLLPLHEKALKLFLILTATILPVGSVSRLAVELRLCNKVISTPMRWYCRYKFFLIIPRTEAFSSACQEALANGGMQYLQIWDDVLLIPRESI